MAIKIVEHALEYQDRVQAFNRRMKENGSPWAFYEHPIPRWIPKRGDQSAWRQYYLALDENDEVRGGYCLKHQAFWFGGRVHKIASFQGPVSEGVIDRKYGLVTVCMIRDMLAREPNLFAFGANASIARLLRANRWSVLRTPMCLKVIKPNRFLRLNRMLRKSTTRKWILDGLAFSGLGWIGLKSLNSMRKIAHRRPLQSDYEIVEEFGEWTDELWLSSREPYAISAVRDCETFNLLMPKDGWPPVIRLKITFGGQVIGTAAVLDTPMQDDRRFGYLRVGAIVDNFGQLEHCPRIVAAATHLLEQRGVDLIISNQTHPQWLAGFCANGFHVLKGHRILALSKSLERQWGPVESLLRDLHMNTIDGDGPLGLAPAGMPFSATYSE